MSSINKKVLMRFLNKIPDGYDLEYQTLNFDKAVLMFSSDSNKAYLFAKNYRSPYLAHYTAELLKETKAIDNIYAYHINKGKVSSFDWKNASKDIDSIIKQFEDNNKLPETTSIQSTVYNILLNDRTTNENSEFKNINPKFVSGVIASKFAYSDMRNIYQCQRKTERSLNKIMRDLFDDLVAEPQLHQKEALTNETELKLVKSCLQPYFRTLKENKNEQINEIQIGDTINDLPTIEVKFDEPLTAKPNHTPKADINKNKA